jgi:YidC/Oxa1 family membrane protein insertase
MKMPQRWAKQRNRNATTISEKGGKQAKKMKMMQNVFAIVMAVIVAFSATGVGVYWFLNALFSMGQSYIMHKVILRSRKNKRLESKLTSLGLD